MDVTEILNARNRTARGDDRTPVWSAPKPILVNVPLTLSTFSNVFETQECITARWMTCECIITGTGPYQAHVRRANVFHAAPGIIQHDTNYAAKFRSLESAKEWCEFAASRLFQPSQSSGPPLPEP